MATDTNVAPASPEPAAKAVTSDAKKSGGVKLGQASHMLLKREAALIKAQAPAEGAAKPAEKPAETATTTASDAGTKPAPDLTPEVKVETKVETGTSEDALSKSISPEVQASIDKRIGSVLEKARVAEEKVKALEARLAQQAIAAPVAIQPTPDNPLANVNDVAALQKQLSTAKETKLWALEQLDRDDIDRGVQVGDTTYSKAQLKAAIRSMERLIEVHVPERANFLQQRAQFEKQARENFEFLGDPSSDQFRTFQRLITTDIDLAKKANGVYLAAAAVEGQNQANLRAAIAASNQGTRPVKEVRQVAPASQVASGGSVGAGSREAGGTGTRALAALATEMDKMKRSGKVTIRDAAKYFRQKEINR